MFYHLLLAFLLLPIKSCTSAMLERYNYRSNLTLSMVPPPGGSISTEKVDSYEQDQFAKPGCTLNTIKRSLSDGSTEVTRTLRCTTIKIKNPAGKVDQKPAPGSRTSENDLKTIESFMLNS